MEDNGFFRFSFPWHCLKPKTCSSLVSHGLQDLVAVLQVLCFDIAQRCGIEHGGLTVQGVTNKRRNPNGLAMLQLEGNKTCCVASRPGIRTKFETTKSAGSTAIYHCLVVKHYSWTEQQQKTSTTISWLPTTNYINHEPLNTMKHLPPTSNYHHGRHLPSPPATLCFRSWPPSAPIAQLAAARKHQAPPWQHPPVAGNFCTVKDHHWINNY